MSKHVVPSPADLLFQAAASRGGQCVADTIEFVARWRNLGLLDSPNGRALVAGWWKPGMPNVEPLDEPLFSCQTAMDEGSKVLSEALELLDAIEALAYKHNWHESASILCLTGKVEDRLSRLKDSLKRQATILNDVRGELCSEERDGHRERNTKVRTVCVVRARLQLCEMGGAS